jgi:rod shape-determining protein MreD
MIRYFSRHIVNFIFLILFQVLILNNIQVSGYINPYLYVLFIILLPFETPKWLLLVTGFMLGLSIDLFSNAIGMHTFATVLIAFLRPYLLKYIAPYAILLILIHHFALFFMEAFKFQQFFATLLRVILSSIFTLLLVVLSQLLTLRR